MSYQIIFRHASSAAALGEVATQSDMFPLEGGMLGVAIPTRVFETAGEERILASIAGTSFFDLWAGEWREPNQSSEPTPPSVTPRAEPRVAPAAVVAVMRRA